MSDFRFLSPTDVDKFIQVPVTLSVDATDLALTVQEDTLMNYDVLVRKDYVIFCDIKKTDLLNLAGMDWKYRLIDELNQPQPYSYFRFVAHSTLYGEVFAMSEVKINGTQTGIESVSSSSTYTASDAVTNLLDGSGSTRYASWVTYSTECEYGERNTSWMSTITYDASRGNAMVIGDWLQLQLPAQVAITGYQLAFSSYGPMDWTLMGSNDGRTWFSVDRVSGFAYTSATVSGFYFPAPAATAAYSYFRLVVHKLQTSTPDTATRWFMNEVTLYSQAADASGTTLAWPPAALPNATTTLSGQANASQNGTYVYNDVFNGTVVTNMRYLFDKMNSTPFNSGYSRYMRARTSDPPEHRDLTRFTLDASSGVTYMGDFLQLQLPAAIVLNSYDILTSSDGVPMDWYMFGSNDGLTWSMVDSRVGFTDFTVGKPVTFTANAVNGRAFSFYRMAITKLFQTGYAPWATPQIYELTFRALDPSGDAAAGLLSYPPAALTANVTTLSGQVAASQNGTYVAYCSTIANAGWQPWTAFDKNTATRWASAHFRYSKNMKYGIREQWRYNMTRDVYFNQYRGEWFQVKMASPTTLASFSLTPSVSASGNPGLFCPAEMTVLGSTDGVNWRLVDRRRYAEADWPGPVEKVLYPAYGQYAGIKLLDAHNPARPGDLAMTQPILSVVTAKRQLGELTDKTRFSHYKQAGQFFKYSFKVGDSLQVPVQNESGADYTYTDASGVARPVTRRAQLYGVYLDTTWGSALPYWVTVSGAGADQTPETRVFYYADDVPLGGSGTLPAIASGAVATASSLVSSLDGTPVALTVVAPPDPEFLENNLDASGSSIIGGSLAVRKDASGNLVLRNVGPVDASGVGRIGYTQANFARFTADPSRALLLYWLLDPPLSGTADAVHPPYMGEDLFVAWTSRDLLTASGGFRPVTDYFDDFRGKYSLIPSNQPRGKFLELFKFVTNRDAAAGTVYNVRTSARGKGAGLQLSGAAPHLNFPVSLYHVWVEKPYEADANGTSSAQAIPFAYGVMNKTDFSLDKRRSILGGRLMQMISHYLFDAAGNKEVAYFPYWLNESKQLTDKIIDALSTLLQRDTDSGTDCRTSILRQLEVKHGRKYFDEYAVLNSVTNERVGNVRDVLTRINEIYINFLITLRTTVSQQAKDNAEVLRFDSVPVVIRATD